MICKRIHSSLCYFLPFASELTGGQTTHPLVAQQPLVLIKVPIALIFQGTQHINPELSEPGDLGVLYQSYS